MSFLSSVLLQAFHTYASHLSKSSNRPFFVCQTSLQLLNRFLLGEMSLLYQMRSFCSKTMLVIQTLLGHRLCFPGFLYPSRSTCLALCLDQNWLFHISPCSSHNLCLLFLSMLYAGIL